MANEKITKKHRLAEALGNRSYYLEKIHDLQNCVENEQKMDKLTLYQLTQKRERVANLFENKNVPL